MWKKSIFGYWFIAHMSGCNSKCIKLSVHIIIAKTIHERNPKDERPAGPLRPLKSSILLPLTHRAHGRRSNRISATWWVARLALANCHGHSYALSLAPHLQKLLGSAVRQLRHLRRPRVEQLGKNPPDRLAYHHSPEKHFKDAPQVPASPRAEHGFPLQHGPKLGKKERECSYYFWSRLKRLAKKSLGKLLMVWDSERTYADVAGTPRQLWSHQIKGQEAQRYWAISSYHNHWEFSLNWHT